jgi:hypothetical protein
MEPRRMTVKATVCTDPDRHLRSMSTGRPLPSVPSWPFPDHPRAGRGRCGRGGTGASCRSGASHRAAALCAYPTPRATPPGRRTRGRPAALPVQPASSRPGVPGRANRMPYRPGGSCTAFFPDGTARNHVVSPRARRAMSHQRSNTSRQNHATVRRPPTPTLSAPRLLTSEPVATKTATGVRPTWPR